MEIEKHLSTFIKEVVRQSKSNLTRQDRNVSKKLYNSIKGDYKIHKNSIGLYFTMEEHGEYLDKGVKGKKSGSLAPKSPYRFGSGTGKKGGLTEGIKKWVKSRGFQFRDKQGKFMSFESTAFLITRKIYNKGTKPSLFFTKAFEGRFKKLPNELIEKFGLDIDEQFNEAFK